MRAHRDAVDETQEVFADTRLGWSQKKLSMLETGRVPVTLKVMEEFAAALGGDMTVPDLIAPLYAPPQSPEQFEAAFPAAARHTAGVILSNETFSLQRAVARRDARHVVAALAMLPDHHVKWFRYLAEAVAYRHQQGDPDPEFKFPLNIIPSASEEPTT